MKTKIYFFLLACLFVFAGNNAYGHFGMMIPSDNMITAGETRELTLVLSFSHPMEMVGMSLVKPRRYGVLSNEGFTDLRSKLQKTSVMDQLAWRETHSIRRPGVYHFFMEPEPYWEPSEDCFIIHYTKTVISAFGDDEGWDQEIGLKTEISPLTRPFGLYAGNAFQGIVKLDNKPVPFATVEVEYYNRDKKARAPNDLMITQTIKADSNGVFTYVPPSSGWWGFAALNTADFTLKTPEGIEKPVEVGAVLWIHFESWAN